VLVLVIRNKGDISNGRIND